MKFAYNTKYYPPAPRLQIRLGVPDESLKVGPLTAFLDSGADTTLVPLRYIRRLPVSVDNLRQLRSQWGESRVVEVYRLDVGIGDIRLPAVQIVADKQGNEIIVGRNILNLLRVFMDGPKQIVDISE